MSFTRGNSLYQTSLMELQQGFSGGPGSPKVPLTSMNLEDMIKQAMGTLLHRGGDAQPGTRPHMMGGLELPSDMRGKTVEEVWASVALGHEEAQLNTSEPAQATLATHKHTVRTPHNSDNLLEMALGPFLEEVGIDGAKNLMGVAYRPSSISSIPGSSSLHQHGHSIFRSIGLNKSESVVVPGVGNGSHPGNGSHLSSNSHLSSGSHLGSTSMNIQQHLTVEELHKLHSVSNAQQHRQEPTERFAVPVDAVASKSTMKITRTPSQKRQKVADAKEARAARMQGRKRKNDDGEVEEFVTRMQERKVKNRESAARSRNRKQQYTDELELEVQKLTEENETLKNEMNTVQALPPYVGPMTRSCLRRTRSTPN